MPAQTIYLVVDKETGRIECGFPRKISADTYIAGERLAAWMLVQPALIFEEYDDAKNHAAHQARMKALAKLSPEDRRALGIKE